MFSIDKAANSLDIRFICYIGIAYQLPGSFMGERANLLTGHMKVMGLRDSARIMYATHSSDVKMLPYTYTML